MPNMTLKEIADDKYIDKTEEVTYNFILLVDQLIHTPNTHMNLSIDGTEMDAFISRCLEAKNNG